MDVSTHIREVIRAEGPITFDRFMDLALYGPGGFYEQPPVGNDGHFVTSPHVHPIFGELVAEAIEGLWGVIGEPTPLDIVDVGAGDGTLAQQLLKGLPGMMIRYTACERSAAGREQIAQLGDAVNTADSFDTLATFRGVVVAHELLDNLPFRRLRGKPGGAVELQVGLEGDRFVEVEVKVPIELSEHSPDLKPGEETVVSLETLRFVQRMAAVLLLGYVIIIDYGGEEAGDVHGYRSQRLIEDVLDAPGTADITAGVNFAAVAAHAERLGFQVFGPIEQREALRTLGFQQWMDSERHRQRSLLAEGAGLDAVKAWSDRQAASLLVDPAGLGAFRWMVLATPDLPQPPWSVSEEQLERERGRVP